MLPRHLLSRAVRARSLALARQAPLSRALPVFSSSSLLLKHNFHSSAPRHDELPKSPYRAFVDTLKDELRKSRELQDSVHQLQGDVEKFQDSEAMKKARDMYERARLQSSIKENPKLRAAAEELRKQGLKVGDAVGDALKSMEESDLARAVCGVRVGGTSLEC